VSAALYGGAVGPKEARRYELADAARQDDLQRHGVNLEAIVEAREGMVGDELADHWIAMAERVSRAYLAPDASESAKVARLHFEIGQLRGYLRQACANYASVVNPVEVA
jgi:hypothetical protein